MTIGIELTLQALTSIAWQNRLNPATRSLARRLTDPESNRHGKVDAIVDEMHRCYSIRDPTTPETLRDIVALDADNAALTVASLAMSVGIRCRLVGARYGQSWTCFVAYEVGDHWETVNPLQQRADRDPDEPISGPRRRPEQKPDEQVVGPMPDAGVR